MSTLRVGWSTVSRAWLPIVGAVATVALWWTATVVFNIDKLYLPAPPDIVKAFLTLPDYLLNQGLVTLTETLLGFGIAVVSGLALAVALSASRLVERATLPLLVAANSIPKLALAPLLLVWMGFGTAPRTAMVFLISFFPIIVASLAGLHSTPAELTELAKSLTVSRWNVFVKFRLPWAVPQMFIGLKLAITLAVVGAVVAEFSGGDQGLGFVITSAGPAGDTALAFAAITLLAVISVSLFYLVVGLERLMVPWARETSG